MTRTSRILAAASTGLMFCFAAHGTQSVSLTWSANTDPANGGYILHLGAKSHTYTTQINVGTNTVVTLSGLKDGQTYYFMVGCYNLLGLEGLPSNEASFVAPTNTTQTQPAGNSFTVTPASGSPGTEVDIYPANPGAVSGVSFNGVSASFTIVSNAYLAVTVPTGATTGPLNLTTSSGTVAGRFTVTPTTGPANDNFANAQVLSGSNASAWATTTGATREPGEPNHGGNSGGASVWYRWTAPATGAYTLDTAGTQFVPLLGIYTGNSVSQLSVVASNVAPTSAPLNFQATRGTTYQIAVDGYRGQSGNMMLRLSQAGMSAVTGIFSETFDLGGYGGSALAGQNGWVGSVPALSGLAANLFPGYGLQGYLGLTALSLGNNTVWLYHPLNFAIDTNNQPVIHFSVLLQINNPLKFYKDSFGWAFRNASGQQLFNIMFNNATGQITYGLDDGAGQKPTGYNFVAGSMSQLEVTADFSQNEWSATLNGTLLMAGQPITTIHSPLTLGDIDAEAIYSGLLAQLDGMLFDNFSVTAEPELAPNIIVAPQSQTLASGKTTALSVIASGAPPLFYQWYYAGQPIAGATNGSLWLTNVTSAANGNYDVLVGNESDLISADCLVRVSNPPVMAQIVNAAVTGTSARAVNFSVINGRSYRVQTSTNMTAWSPSGSFYAKGTNAAYFDAATMSTRRFYRLASP